MNDRILGVFPSKSLAHEAADLIVASGVDRERVVVERVLESDHRGLGDSTRVHSLIHAPRIEDDDHVSDDAGTIIVIVEMADPPTGDAPRNGSDFFDNAAMKNRLESLGATETAVVEATPGLDL